MDCNEISQKEINELAAAFAKFIPILAGTAGIKNTRFITANVTAVSEEDRTCSITGILDEDEIKYTDVNLSAERNDGRIEIPAIDSTVLVACMPDGEKYVILNSDITKVIIYIDANNKLEFDSSGWVWNGGALGGMVKVIDLTTKLNNLENKLNTLLGIFNSWIVVANDGGAALKALYTALAATTLAPLTVTVQANIENTKIKQ